MYTVYTLIRSGYYRRIWQGTDEGDAFAWAKLMPNCHVEYRRF